MQDLDMDPNLPGGQTFIKTVIGDVDLSDFNAPFDGVFDGNHKTIRNLHIVCDEWGACNAGLFSEVGEHGIVKNVNLTDEFLSIYSLMNMGALTGTNRGIITNCSVSAEAVVESAGEGLGGIAGRNTGTITDCQSRVNMTGRVFSSGAFAGYNSGSILRSSAEGSLRSSGEWYATLGGFIGSNNGFVQQCRSACDTSGVADIGGFVGSNGGEISDCYAEGRVTGEYLLGGFAASCSGATTISSSYSKCTISVENNPENLEVGGFVNANYGTVYLCYWDALGCGISTSRGGVPKTSAEMKDAQTFAGWGFDSAWTIDSGSDYPRLAWENKPGVPIIDAPRSYGGGSGSAEDPYRISTQEHLLTLGLHREDFDKHFVLTADIGFEHPDVPEESYSNFNVIGTPANPFCGSFDGRGHTLSGLSYDALDNEYAGLFGRVESVNGSPAQIANLKLVSPVIRGSYYAGAVVGFLKSGTVRNCGVENGSVQADAAAGGLAGYIVEGTLLTSYACADIACSEILLHRKTAFGGLAGVNEGGTIDSCYAKGSVRVEPEFWDDRVFGEAGGLVGQNDNGCIITSFSAVRDASKAQRMNGLVGSDTAGSYFLSYWNCSLNWVDNGHGIPRLTSELQDPQNFRGWGDNVWTLDAGQDYPHLAWENQPGSPIVDAPRAYGGGDGTPQNPYRMQTRTHMETLSWHRQDFDKCFILTDDISLFRGPLWQPANARPIGTKGVPFTGTFDGNGHTVSDLLYFGTGNYIGMFGAIESPAPDAIRNLTIEYPCIETYNENRIYVGGLAGYIENTQITNCQVVSPWITSGNAVGGLAGYIVNSRISDCSVDDGMISACTLAGGLVGWARSGDLCRCDVSGEVYGENVAGGLAGSLGRIFVTQLYPHAFAYADDLPDAVNVSQCTASAIVSGDLNVGGFAGFQTAGTINQSFSCSTVVIYSSYGDGGGFVCRLDEGTIADCHAETELWGNSYCATFLSAIRNGTVRNCYSTGMLERSSSEYGRPEAFISTTFQANVNACFFSETLGYYAPAGVQALSESQMKQRASFFGWDFLGESVNGQNEIWRMCQDGVDYPRLSWEFAREGDFACSDGVDLADLQALAEQWLTRSDTAPAAFNYACDADADGSIGLPDLLTLSGNW